MSERAGWGGSSAPGGVPEEALRGDAASSPPGSAPASAGRGAGTTDPFPPTHAVFHDPALYAQEAVRVFSGWRFLCCADQVPRSGVWGRRNTPGGEVRFAQEGGRLRALQEGAPRPVAWLGRLAFVHAGEEAPERSLEDALGEALPLARSLGAAVAECLLEVRMSLGANWKLVVSGAIEDYHLPVVHAATVNPYRLEPARPVLFAGGHSVYTAPARVGRLLRALHGALAGEPSEERFTNLLLYPNLLLIRLWGLVHVTVFEPRGPARTLRRTRIYAPSLPGARRPLQRALGAFLRLGILRAAHEDRRAVEEAHAGTLAAREALRGPAHAEEARVEHFLAETAARVRCAQSSAAPPPRGRAGRGGCPRAAE
ncbi:MAG: hypothetical protein D6731_11450 [Planctomycetota bacterium]|nr:MAG: hypothetical protein D6731_11450 [Planctomycetota bacterium]